MNSVKLLNEDHIRSKRSESLDFLENIKLINEISMDEALLGPSIRSKRALKGGSVSRKRLARRNVGHLEFDYERRLGHPQAQDVVSVVLYINLE